MNLNEALKAIANVLSEASGNISEAAVSQTIVNQIKALDKQAFAAWGAKEFVNMNDGLKFKVGGMTKWKGYVYVKYDKGSDLYNIQFFRIVKMEIKTDKEAKGVQAENLVQVIDAQVG